MITVRKTFTCPTGEYEQAAAVTKEYKALFDSSPTCRIYRNASGQGFQLHIEDDFESLADYEVKWAERTATPEFQTWIKKWYAIAIDGSFEINILRAIE